MVAIRETTSASMIAAAGRVRQGSLASRVPELSVQIDIKPGGHPNSIDLSEPRDLIPVAILTTSVVDGDSVDFDPFDNTDPVDPATLALGPSAVTIFHAMGHAEDVDKDGDLDMVLHFQIQNTGIACGDTEATLTGETFGGQAIAGTDSIKTVGCKVKEQSFTTLPAAGQESWHLL